MTVCLHCGELASEGALFCTKCGYTLPQVDPSVKPAASSPTPPPAPVGASPPAGVPPPAAPLSPPVAPLMGFGWTYAPTGYAVLAPPPVPGAVGPMPPPPAGKYCIRCRTLISQAAVYCPVCQQPQA